MDEIYVCWCGCSGREHTAVTMMELELFIAVRAELAAGGTNDGNIWSSVAMQTIPQSVSLKCLSLFGILHYECRGLKKSRSNRGGERRRRRWRTCGEEIRRPSTNVD